MKLFLSYAAEDRALAEETSLALAGAGNEVFFDRSDLPPGGEFHLQIQQAIEDTDGFVFLISPESLEDGCYAQTELALAQEKWKHPKGKVLPVMVRATDYERIPAYLRAVTILEPHGNIAAETVHAVGQWDRPSKTRRSLMDDVRKLAEQGKPDAQIALANAYASGAGVSPDINEAIRWYMAAALGGSKAAGEQLAKFLWKLADNGDATIQHMLGSGYRTGDIWSADIEMARYWLQRAAEQGHEEAARELQEMDE